MSREVSAAEGEVEDGLAVSFVLGEQEHEDGALAPYVAIGLFAGLRTSELVTLDWSEVDFSEHTITVLSHKAKSRSRRIVEMSANLVAWLRPYAQREGRVVPDGYMKRFARMRVAAGLLRWPKNALRHSAASYHLAMHKNEALTQAMMGHHSSRMLYAHYRQLVTPKEAARFWKLSPGSVEDKLVAFGAVAA